jgi:flagellar motility protein MotE (MotC chaperone)
MADETPVPKTPEQKAENAKKKELRRLKNDIKVARDKAKDLGEERKKLEASYNSLAAEMGLPPRGKKDKPAE